MEIEFNDLLDVLKSKLRQAQFEETLAAPPPRRLQLPLDMSARELRECATRIVVAFLSRNEVASSEIAPLVQQTLQAIAQPEIYWATPAEDQSPTPVARPEVKQVDNHAPTDKNFVTCLECGKKFKSLRRHLSEIHGMTPDKYVKKWNVSADEALVAQSLSEKRSKMAQMANFGQVKKRTRK
jgi:predicted transcriptional regulator